MRSPSLLWGAALVALLLAATLLAPVLAPYDPDEQLDPAAAKVRPPGTSFAAVHLADGRWRLAERVRRTPVGLEIERITDLGRTVERYSAAQVLNLTPDGVADQRRFLLGSDDLGRDVWSRLLRGARVSLAVGILSVVLALTLGVAVGAAAAAAGGWTDAALMRGVDALLSFPRLFLMIGVVALFRPSQILLVLVLGGTAWMGMSRMARAEILSLESREFILAARGTGQGPLAVLWRHLLPGALPPILAQATLNIADIILAESALSFLGLGVQPPTPSWGNMIADGQEILTTAWWTALFPGLAVALTVLAFNLLGDGLRDALDPRTRRRSRRRGW